MTVADDLATLREQLIKSGWSLGPFKRVEAEMARLRDGLRILSESAHPSTAAIARALLAEDGAAPPLPDGVFYKIWRGRTEAEDVSARDERCDKCGLPRDAHPGRLFCPAPGGAAQPPPRREYGGYMGGEPWGPDQ